MDARWLQTIVICGALTGLALFIRKKVGKEDIPSLSDDLNEKLRETINELKTTSKQPVEPVEDYVVRLERLERRQDTLQNDVLRQLQKISTAEARMKRAAPEEEVLPEEEAEGELTKAQAHELLAAPAQNSNHGGRISLEELESM